MSFRISLRPRAEADLARAWRWYDDRLPGLGELFLRSADECFARLAIQPLAHPEVHPRVRRAPLRRFPYGVFYVVRETRVDVLAV